MGLERWLSLPQRWDFNCSSIPASILELNLKDSCPRSTPVFNSFSGAAQTGQWEPKLGSAVAKITLFLVVNVMKTRLHFLRSVVRHKMHGKNE